MTLAVVINNFLLGSVRLRCMECFHLEVKFIVCEITLRKSFDKITVLFDKATGGCKYPKNYHTV